MESLGTFIRIMDKFGGFMERHGILTWVIFDVEEGVLRMMVQVHRTSENGVLRHFYWDYGLWINLEDFWEKHGIFTRVIFNVEEGVLRMMVQVHNLLCQGDVGGKIGCF
jgi:hypothetical protein